MWCCWISPGHNLASTQRRGRHASNIVLRDSLEPRHTFRSARWQLRGRAYGVELTQPPGNLVPTGRC